MIQSTLAAMSGNDNPERASGPSYNPIFERLVPSGTDLDMQGLVAYGLYKVAKREWAAQIWDTQRRPPTEEELRAYILTWTPSRLDGLRQQAEGALATFSADVIQAETPAIREEALRGTTASALKNAIYGNAAYTILLILFVLILSWAGVDLLGLLEKAKPPK